MPTDFRLRSDFLGHPKLVKLQGRLGPSAQLSWLHLLGFAAEYKPDGQFAGYTAEDIQLAARWSGEGDFVQTLVDLRLLDFDGKTYVLHNWAVHQTWLMGAETRREKARKAQAAKHQKKGREETPEESPEAIPRDAPDSTRSSAGSKTPGTASRTASSNASSTTPLPSPPLLSSSQETKGNGNKYPLEFEQAWRSFRHGENDNKTSGYKTWQARMRSNDDPALILAGIQRYVYYLDHTPWRSPMLFSTFLGPNKNWLLPWKLEPAGRKDGSSGQPAAVPTADEYYDGEGQTS